MNYIDRIKNLREDNDFSQTYIAKILHVAQTTYSDYESGKVRLPVESLIRLAQLYDVDMNYICGISDSKHPFANK